MISTYSPTIRRKEMEAVLTCMVDEKIGPGELNLRLIQTVKEMTECDGAVALRSPALALEYALKALSLESGSGVILSALAPSWQILTVEKLGFKPMVLDVAEDTACILPELVDEAVKNGARVLILTETMGILPDIKQFLSFGIPVIEDISQSALSYYPLDESDVEVQKQLERRAKKEQAAKASGEVLELAEIKGKRAGMYGTYAILGLEDRDILTCGGGAVLMAPNRREWIVLKKLADEAQSVDILPDLSCALAYVEFKEFARNEKVRRELFTAYSRAIMSGKHKTFVRAQDDGSTICSFPLVLNTGFKDAKAYAQKKDIEIRQAFENSIIALRQESLASECICANSLLLRTALFPLYPRLGKKDVERIIKVLSTLL